MIMQDNYAQLAALIIISWLVTLRQNCWNRSNGFRKHQRICSHATTWAMPIMITLLTSDSVGLQASSYPDQHWPKSVGMPNLK